VPEFLVCHVPPARKSRKFEKWTEVNISYTISGILE
jgi:hypothetical protein